MSFFEGVILNVILLLTPIFGYIIFLAYNQNLRKKESDVIFDLINLSSVYLIIKFSSLSISSVFMLLINIPFIISMYKRRTASSVIIAIVIICYNFFVFKIPLPIMISEYIIYLILFELVFTKIKKYETVLNVFTFIKGVILSIEIIYLIPNEDNYYVIIFRLFFILLAFYLISILVIKLISKAEEIISFNNILKELEKEKTLKNALFKITHEIKNPIAVCKGYLSMMNYNDVKNVEKYNNIIKSEIERTLSIMDDFGDYSKINVNLDIMDINMLLEETVFAMNSLFKEKDIKVISHIPDTEYYINGDYNKLKQVLVNIIKNSIEAVKDKGCIKVNSRTKSNNILIYIEDNGIGMSKEVLTNIKDIFYTTKEKGTGLGVTLSNEIVKLHNGNLIYESKENRGTKVIIEIPLIKTKSD